MSRAPLAALHWIALAAAAGFAVYGGLAWRDAARIRDVMLNGREGAAVVDGGAAGLRALSGGRHAVDLVWRDGSGADRRAEGLVIGDALAHQIARGAVGNPPTLAIRFAETGDPVIAQQAAFDQEANAARMATAGSGLLVAALAALILLFVRRRASVPPSP